MTVSNPMRVAVLVNTYNYPLTPDLKQSFLDAIHGAAGSCPGALVDFYDPIEKQEYPDPASYSLIVLTGGTENMTAPVSSHKTWVVKMQEFLRNTVRESPQTKILGTCWGHQIICVAFGGEVGTMEKSEVCCLPVGR
jgi:GMP synthase-like glutamine amidotransferase